jgi:signal transduction histidine kinase
MTDRIQLQQVLLNLIMNGIEAMSGAGHSPRELWVSSEKQPAMPAESGADDFESERRFVRDDPPRQMNQKALCFGLCCRLPMTKKPNAHVADTGK